MQEALSVCIRNEAIVVFCLCCMYQLLHSFHGVLHLLHDTPTESAVCNMPLKSAVDAKKVSKTVCAHTFCMGICGCIALTCYCVLTCD